MRPFGVEAAAAAAGAVAAAVTDVSLRGQRSRTPLSAAILVGAALVYPVAGGASPARNVVRREKVSAGAALAVAVAAVALPDRPARAVVASGSVLHALFDQMHTVSMGSRLPRWYPALCAGYDLAMAAALSRK